MPSPSGRRHANRRKLTDRRAGSPDRRARERRSGRDRRDTAERRNTGIGVETRRSGQVGVLLEVRFVARRQTPDRRTGKDRRGAP
jgi:hypothetical protein